ncbi:MAG TPA: spermidine/putrescine ABC transporter substrate-binding protein [Thermoclostridium sp.]|nr:spermidine/putrescine ABC transporter substrate-binding protein [Thermoclostridium sp.]
MKKMKVFTIILMLILSVGLVTGCTTTGTTKKTLNLFTWEGMFPQEVLTGFEKETGISINYNNFDFDETMLAKLQAAKGGDYDLVIADDYIIEMVIEEGLAQKIDKSKLKNHNNINSIYQGHFYDPNDEYTVPFGAGVQTIVFDPSRVDIDIKGYADLFDPALKDNIGVIANHRVINGLALKILGESYNTEDIATIEKAGEKLLGLAPNIRVIKDDNLQDDLLSGEVSAAVMYTSQVTMAMLTNPDLKVVYPSEGIGFGIMAGFIPSKAPNSDAAHAFMDYLLRPEIAAQYFEWLGYYSTIEAADSHINEQYRDFLTLPSDFSGDTEMIKGLGAEAEEAHTKVWTEFKAVAGKN